MFGGEWFIGTFGPLSVSGKCSVVRAAIPSAAQGHCERKCTSTPVDGGRPSVIRNSPSLAATAKIHGLISRLLFLSQPR